MNTFNIAFVSVLISMTLALVLSAVIVSLRISPYYISICFFIAYAGLLPMQIKTHKMKTHQVKLEKEIKEEYEADKAKFKKDFHRRTKGIDFSELSQKDKISFWIINEII